MAAVKDAYNRIVSVVISRFKRKKSDDGDGNRTRKCVIETGGEPEQKVVYRKPPEEARYTVTEPRPRSATFGQLVRATFRHRAVSYHEASTKLYDDRDKEGLRKLKRRHRRRHRDAVQMIMSEIRLSDERIMPLEAFSSRLNDYNTYYQGRPEELRQRQNRKGELVIDGLLNIYWGLRTSIRLQEDGKTSQQDRASNGASRHSCFVVADDVKIRPRIEEIKEVEARQAIEDTKSSRAASAQIEVGSLSPRNSVNSAPPPRGDEAPDPADGSPQPPVAFRARSVVMRKRGARASYRKRASINGHYYNHETSVFTPTHGSVTKVRVLSTNNAHDVIAKLFQKFRVENAASGFSLYVVKETEELREMPHHEFPLVSRVLIGPSEQVGKIFIMEKKMHKEISPEVAQYIKLDPNILRVFLSKFAEEEDREILKMKKRFEFYRKMLKRNIREMSRREAEKEERDQEGETS